MFSCAPPKSGRLAWRCAATTRPDHPSIYTVAVDLLRYFDAAFFGAKIEYRAGQIPDTVPLLAGDRKNLLFDRGLPDPLTGGIFAHAHHLHEAMAHRIRAGFTYHGKPVKLAPFGTSHDGPLTVATSLRGQELYLDFYTDPEYVRQLLDFIVEGTVGPGQGTSAFLWAA